MITKAISILIAIRNGVISERKKGINISISMEPKEPIWFNHDGLSL